MKHSLFVLLLWACSHAYAQTYTTVIDSLSENASVVPMGQLAGVNAVFDVFVSDSSGIQSVIVQIGSQSGLGDLFQKNYPVSQNHLSVDSSSGYLYFQMNAGNFILYPPFVRAWLQFSDGSTSAVFQKQFVF